MTARRFSLYTWALVVLWTCTAFASAKGSLKTDRDALMDLFRSTTGPKWKDKTGWNTSTNVCTWKGVSCQDDDDGEPRVSSLALMKNKLAGSLPASIGKLSHLTSLDVTDNKLNGTIPPSIGGLKELHVLHLFGNQLTGPLPPTIGKLKQLTHMHIHLNKLSGTMPEEIGKLKSIIHMTLGENNFWGSLPKSMTKLKRLKYLHVQNCCLTNYKEDWFLSLCDDCTDGCAHSPQKKSGTCGENETVVTPSPAGAGAAENTAAGEEL